MGRFDLSALTALLHEAAGGGNELGEDDLDTLFLDLGYDSLALLQVTGVIERDYDVTLEEEAVDEAETPRQFLDLVNGALAGRAAV
ncbi:MULTISPECIES: phosphopantetheine-binding protein [Streptomyces]|uniref:phosphopantetheine-binding protein n=1 Tax=Streptomyces TaxID=1883 RepID=UPI0004BD96FD|nr:MULTISPECIES: phosphopantetheine-binding protein [Streptomyces]NNG86707.1 acyl carrier protein [Streptomyces cacaoi]QHF97363.1 acyl carrier protein [Streptomyces sp. NHF165]